MPHDRKGLVSYPNSYPQLLGSLGGLKDELWCRIQIGTELPKLENEVIKNYLRTHTAQEILQEMGFESVSSNAERFGGIFWALKQLKFREIDVRSIPTVKQLLKELHELYGLYDKLCKDEYSQIKEELTPEFKGRAKKKGMEPWRYYQWLRQFYFAKGVIDPPKELNKIESEARFLGFPVTGGLLPEMKNILKDTEIKLQDMGRSVGQDLWTELRYTITKKAIGGFVPRPLNDETALSPHALGEAIDIEADTNPHIKGNDAKLVDEVLTWLNVPEEWRFSKPLFQKNLLQTDDVMIMEIHTGMQEMSKAIQNFLYEWLERWEQAKEAKKYYSRELKKIEKSPRSYPVQWVDHVRQELFKAENELQTNSDTYDQLAKLVKAFKGSNNARRYRDKGLITLTVYLCIALKTAGAQWGGEFESHKDAMHFNMPPKKRQKPPCIEKLKQ